MRAIREKNPKCDSMQITQINLRTPILEAANRFKVAVANGPNYTCVICHRLMYRSSVQIFHERMIASFDTITKNDFINHLHMLMVICGYVRHAGYV